MTGNLLIDLAVSFVGVAILVGVSYLLGAMRSAIVTDRTAAERLEFDEPDFRAGEWLIGADGKSAAALSVDGAETALVFAVGDRLASRRFRHGAVGIERVGATVIFRMGELSLPKARLEAADEDAAEQWVLRLAGRRL